MAVKIAEITGDMRSVQLYAFVESIGELKDFEHNGEKRQCSSFVLKDDTGTVRGVLFSTYGHLERYLPILKVCQAANKKVFIRNWMADDKYTTEEGEKILQLRHGKFGKIEEGKEVLMSKIEINWKDYAGIIPLGFNPAKDRFVVFFDPDNSDIDELKAFLHSKGFSTEEGSKSLHIILEKGDTIGN